MMKLRYPAITTPRPGSDYTIQPIEPIRQLQSYLYQLVDELNVALQLVETQVTEAKTGAAVASSDNTIEKNAQSTFNSVKSLIIKSADIVNAYYDTINKRLEGYYVAHSDFGTYTQATSQTIDANSESITLLFENIQEIITDIKDMESRLIKVNAYIKPGVLYYDEAGVPVYGLEIGQRTEIDGEEVFNKYARFTSGKLSFYDQNDNEVAYISDYKLYITHAEITGSLVLGGFRDIVQADGSVVTKWYGIGGES